MIEYAKPGLAQEEVEAVVLLFKKTQKRMGYLGGIPKLLKN
jgi:hypothetical protein